MLYPFDFFLLQKNCRFLCTLSSLSPCGSIQYIHFWFHLHHHQNQSGLHSLSLWVRMWHSTISSVFSLIFLFSFATSNAKSTSISAFNIRKLNYYNLHILLRLNDSQSECAQIFSHQKLSFLDVANLNKFEWYGKTLRFFAKQTTLWLTSSRHK